MTEAQSNALQTIIGELKNISPETTINALIFQNNGQIMASVETTTEDLTKKLILNFSNIAAYAETIGGIENLTIQSTDSQLSISTLNDLYLATIASRSGNQEIIKSFTHVLIPTVVNLLEQLSSLPKEEPQLHTSPLEENRTEDPIPEIEMKPTEDPIPEIEMKPTEDPIPEIEETPTIELIPEMEEQPTIEPVPEPFLEPQQPSELFLSSTPTNQLMVEKIVGLMVHSDTVRIAPNVLAQWNDQYDGKQIRMVNIEALDGKKTTCKFKPIKEKRTSIKGVIQIPEKILQALQTEKGKLVMVKPVIE